MYVCVHVWCAYMYVFACMWGGVRMFPVCVHMCVHVCTCVCVCACVCACVCVHVCVHVCDHIIKQYVD